jgi:hypothetical protein
MPLSIDIIWLPNVAREQLLAESLLIIIDGGERDVGTLAWGQGKRFRLDAFGFDTRFDFLVLVFGRNP